MFSAVSPRTCEPCALHASYAGLFEPAPLCRPARFAPQLPGSVSYAEIYTDLRPSPKPSPFETSQGCGCLDSWALGSHDTSSEPQDAGCVPPSAPERTHSAYIPDPADEGDPASEEEGSDCQAAPSLIDGSPALPPASPGLELVTPQVSTRLLSQPGLTLPALRLIWPWLHATGPHGAHGSMCAELRSPSS